MTLKKAITWGRIGSILLILHTIINMLFIIFQPIFSFKTVAELIISTLELIGFVLLNIFLTNLDKKSKKEFM